MTINKNSLILPPPDPPGPVKWIRDNLFGSGFNTLLSLISFVIVYFLLGGAIKWLLYTADWRPITQAPLLYAIGSYPREEMWRVGLSATIVFFLLGVTADTSLWLKVPLYILVIFPTYQIIFLVVGALFGQFKFVWEFEKKIFARFRFKRR